MTLDGEEMRTHEQIMLISRPRLALKRKRNSTTLSKDFARAICLTLNGPNVTRARQAAHDELTRKEAEIAEAEQRIGFREIEVRKESAAGSVWDAEHEVMDAKPATPAGAVALLRLDVELMEGFYKGDDEIEHYAGAIRNVADFFEGTAAA